MSWNKQIKNFCEFCNYTHHNIGVLTKHKKYFCNSNPFREKILETFTKCKYCKKEFRLGGCLSTHERSCYLNPEAKNTDFNIFVENSTYTRCHLKTKILERNLIKYECNICKIGPVWNNQPLVLILDHINGINNDNRLENLRFVCSNCDSQLETYKFRRGKKFNWKVNPDGSGSRLESDEFLQENGDRHVSLPPFVSSIEEFFS